MVTDSALDCTSGLQLLRHARMVYMSAIGVAYLPGVVRKLAYLEVSMCRCGVHWLL